MRIAALTELDDCWRPSTDCLVEDLQQLATKPGAQIQSANYRHDPDKSCLGAPAAVEMKVKSWF